jgi:hypothetical protein
MLTDVLIEFGESPKFHTHPELMAVGGKLVVSSSRMCGASVQEAF